MFDVRDFTFSMVFSEETKDIRFVIDFYEKDEHDTIFLDSQDAWIDHVKDKVATGLTVDEVISEFHRGWWKEVIEDGIKAEWVKQGYKVDEVEFINVSRQFLDTLRALANGVVRDKNLPVRPDPLQNLQGWDRV